MELSINQNSIEPDSAFTNLSVKQVSVLLLVVSGTFLISRLLLLGMPPFTDGGAYACFAYFAGQGESALPAAPINFYPGCLSVLGCDPDAPLLRFRLADAVICSLAAGVASILVYRISNFKMALFLGLLFAISWLHPAVANGGLKNSILPALGCVMAALLLFSYSNTKAQIAGGMLIPLIVLLREPLAIVALTVLASSFILNGRKGSPFAVLGCLVGSLAALAWLWTFRGAPWQVLANYADLQVMFDKLTKEDFAPWAAFTTAFFPMLGLWVCTGVAVASLCIRFDPRKRAIVLVAALLFAAPMFEIFLKIGYAYHWMQLSLGMILIAAVGMSSLDQLFSNRKRMAIPGVSLIVVALLIGQMSLNWKPYRNSVSESFKFAPVMVYGNWDDPCVEDCFYLSLAKYVRSNTQQDDPILVSGFYYVLYPLTQRMPTDVRMFDATFASYANYPARRADWIESNKKVASPALIIETSRMDVNPILRDMVTDYPNRYALTYEIPVDKPIRYALFGARVWSKQAQATPQISTTQPSTTDHDSSLR